MTPETLQAMAQIVGPAGAAWLAVKVALNGARAEIKETRGDVKEIRASLANHSERLAVIESKGDA